MPWKNSTNFREDYPGGYVRNGDAYDGNGNRIGWVHGDGDIQINNDPTNDGQVYHMQDD